MPTDVISFAMEEMGEGEIEIIAADMPTLLGDIIISVERASEQAESYAHTFEREVWLSSSTWVSYTYLGMIMEQKRKKKKCLVCKRLYYKRMV